MRLNRVALMPVDGVVSVKFTGDHYSKYDKQISQLNKQTGKKEVIERSWFKRGTNLIISGYRRGDQWVVRERQKDKIFPVYKILDINDIGELTITRYRADD